MTNVIGLAGLAGSGKSLAAETLERMGYRRIRFSQTLKDMMRALYRNCLLDDEEIERRIEGDLKEVPDPLLGGKTPRYAMQMLGKEWGRDLICPTLWTDIWAIKAQEAVDLGCKVVAEDVRFNTEDDALRKFAGRVVWIERKSQTDVGTHASELFEGVQPDMTCYNYGTKRELEGWFRYVFQTHDDYETAA